MLPSTAPPSPLPTCTALSRQQSSIKNAQYTLAQNARAHSIVHLLTALCSSKNSTSLHSCCNVAGWTPRLLTAAVASNTAVRWHSTAEPTLDVEAAHQPHNHKIVHVHVHQTRQYSIHTRLHVLCCNTAGSSCQPAEVAHSSTDGNRQQNTTAQSTNSHARAHLSYNCCAEHVAWFGPQAAAAAAHWPCPKLARRSCAAAVLLCVGDSAMHGMSWQLLLREGAADGPLDGVATSGMASSPGATATGGNLQHKQCSHRPTRPTQTRHIHGMGTNTSM